MVRKVLSALIMLILFSSFFSFACSSLTTSSPASFTLGNSNPVKNQMGEDPIRLEVEGFIDAQGISMVPVRTIADAVGTGIFWDALTRRVILCTTNTILVFFEGAKIAYVNGSPFELEATVQIVNGKSFVPAGFLEEALNIEINCKNTFEIFDENMKVPILMYHRAVPPGGKIRYPKLEVYVHELREQLTYLKQAGYTPVTLEQFSDFLIEKKPIPRNPIIFTFDDGYKSFYELVYPILQELNFKASLGIITKYVHETRPGAYVSWQQIKEMVDSGLVEVISHTNKHIDLRKASKNELIEELVDSKGVIKDRLNIDGNVLIYPYGAYNQGIIEETKKVYKMGISVGYGVNTYGANPWIIKRIEVTHGDTGKSIVDRIKQSISELPSS